MFVVRWYGLVQQNASGSDRVFGESRMVPLFAQTTLWTPDRLELLVWPDTADKDVNYTILECGKPSRPN